LTVDDYRRLALALPEAVESAHMDHPDFRVRKKIFATLWPEQERGVVMLTPEQQRVVTSAHPDVFAPVAGGWGVKGATSVDLASADAAVVREALALAWRNKAPTALGALFGG
jgi:hypothetical protein